MAKTIRDFGVEPTPEVLERYHEINRWHWEQLEQESSPGIRCW